MHVHIITTDTELLGKSYLISRLAGFWSAEGHEITVGPCRELLADVGILHVDRTHVDPVILPSNPFGRPILNSSVLDISKRRVSAHLLKRGDAWEGQVIIKTDANAFGLNELWEHSRHSWSRMMRPRRMPVWGWRWFRQLPRDRYPVLSHIRKVPGWVWKRSDLVVEKFFPEMEGNEYALRLWMFFGSGEYGVRMFSRDPIVKVASITRYEYLDEVPDSLRRIRSDMKMDFGKFDYVMVGGEAVLLDVNKTPTVSLVHRPGSKTEALSGALLDFAERSICAV